MNPFRSIQPDRPLSSLTLPPAVVTQLQNFAGQLRSGTPSGSPSALILTGGGPSGSTAAAETIAHETGRTLLRIDLRAIASRYIGETEKNLDRILATADPQQSILFFDEADALFGKRSEVKDSHDRYAGAEGNDLLQRLESFSGTVIFGTSSEIDLPACRFPCQVLRLSSK
jgi:SpoVK/Ycf46/Vps4 family AAA+-type ATPase